MVVCGRKSELKPGYKRPVVCRSGRDRGFGVECGEGVLGVGARGATDCAEALLPVALLDPEERFGIALVNHKGKAENLQFGRIEEDCRIAGLRSNEIWEGDFERGCIEGD